MLTAKEASIMSEIMYETALATVLQRIEKQAKQGKISLWFNAEYPAKLFETLKELGYTVIIDADERVTITWSKI